MEHIAKFAAGLDELVGARRWDDAVAEPVEAILITGISIFRLALTFVASAGHALGFVTGRTPQERSMPSLSRDLCKTLIIVFMIGWINSVLGMRVSEVLFR